MRSLVILIAAASLAGLGGCKHSESARTQRVGMNSWAVEQYHDDAIRNGVVAQHTLYNHHFYPNAVELNELGRRDLRILADHYRDNPGRLNLRRGVEEETLYDARVAYVTEALRIRGVDPERIDVQNAISGGSGMASSDVVVILKHMHRPLTPSDATSVIAIPVVAD